MNGWHESWPKSVEQIVVIDTEVVETKLAESMPAKCMAKEKARDSRTPNRKQLALLANLEANGRVITPNRQPKRNRQQTRS